MATPFRHDHEPPREVRIVLLAQSFVPRFVLNMRNQARRGVRFALVALVAALPMWFLWGLVAPEQGPWVALLGALSGSVGFLALVVTVGAAFRALFPGKNLGSIVFCEERIVLERLEGGVSSEGWSWVKSAHEDDEGLWLDVLSLRADQKPPANQQRFPALFFARKRASAAAYARLRSWLVDHQHL